MKSSNAATYERARRLANLALWTIALQRRRLSSEEPEDAEFLLRAWMDFHFFVVALTRLRRAAMLASEVSQLRPKMQNAISAFNASVPHLIKMRNVAEHIDDYAIGKGHHLAVSRKDLEVASRCGNIWVWLGFTMDTEKAYVAAVHLFEALKAGAAEIEKESNQPGRSNK